MKLEKLFMVLWLKSKPVLQTVKSNSQKFMVG